MSTLVDGRNKVCKEICDALGLRNVRSLDLHMRCNSIVTVTAEFCPEEDGMRKMIPILREFNLVEKRIPELESRESHIDSFNEERKEEERC